MNLQSILQILVLGTSATNFLLLLCAVVVVMVITIDSSIVLILKATNRERLSIHFIAS